MNSDRAALRQRFEELFGKGYCYFFWPGIPRFRGATHQDRGIANGFAVQRAG